jgi:hypothetical protein
MGLFDVENQYFFMFIKKQGLPFCVFRNILVNVCLKSLTNLIYYTMKRVELQSAENTFEVLGFSVLTSDEMNEIKGGVDSRPQSRDVDIYIED